MNLINRFLKYLPPGETVLSVIEVEPVLGNIRGAFCATENRVGELWKNSLFSWSYHSIEWGEMARISIEEGTLRCSINITLRLINRETNEPINIRIDNVKKNQGRHFVALATKYIDQNREIISRRTKTCPECDETVKWNAKKCKYCGYIFPFR